MSERTLVVSADDIGLSVQNTDTIFECVDRGSVTSVSLLPNGLAFDLAIKGYTARKPALRIAAHLNLTDGKALSADATRLTDAHGKFKHSPLSLWAAYSFASAAAREAFRKEVTGELRAQIVKMRSALSLKDGEDISVNGHQHVHMIPFVFDAIVGLAPELHIKEVRIPDEPFYFARISLSAYSATHIIGAFFFAFLSPGARGKALRVGMRTNDAFVGLLFSGYVCKETTEAGLAAVMNQRPALTEMVFHPGSCASGELTAWKGITAWHYDEKRTIERVYVMSDDAKKLFAQFRNGTLAAGLDLPKIFRYFVAGSLAASIHLGGLYLFTEHMHMWYVYANVLAFGIGLIVSFILQKFWTFADHSTDRVHHQALIYIAMQLVALAVNTGGLYLLVQYAHMWYLLAEFLLLIAVAAVNFFISNLIIFRKQEG